MESEPSSQLSKVRRMVWAIQVLFPNTGNLLEEPSRFHSSMDISAFRHVRDLRGPHAAHRT